MNLVHAWLVFIYLNISKYICTLYANCAESKQDKPDCPLPAHAVSSGKKEEESQFVHEKEEFDESVETLCVSLHMVWNFQSDNCQ